MKGETVKVRTFEPTAVDPFNADINAEQEIVVDNVLVSPGAKDDLTQSNRPDGVIVRYTLHFPKTFNENLRGAEVNVRGEWYKVVGCPDHYTLENTPGQWWMPVEVIARNG